MKNEYLQKWEEATQDLADYFAYKYFGKDLSDVYWIGDEVGGVLALNDYFFNTQDMVDFLRYKYSVKDMFDYYDYKMDMQMKKKEYMNIDNWKKLKKKI